MLRKRAYFMKEELRLAFDPKRFWGAMILLFLCFNGFSLPNWLDMYGWDPEFRETSLMLTIEGIFFGGVMLIMPLCASIPMAPLQVDELRTSFVDWRIFRGSIRLYTLRKVTAAFVSGAAVAGGAFALHAILWNILASPCNVTPDSYSVIPFAEDCIYYSWQFIPGAWPVYVSMLLGISFCGGIWAITGLTAAVFVQDKLLSLVLPFCVYYLWRAGLPSVLFGSGFPHPADLYNDALTWPTVYQSVAVYLAFGLLCTLLYMAGLKRRVRNA